MPEGRYPKMLFSQDWNIKPSRGRQRKVQSRLVEDLFASLKLDKANWLKDILDGSSSCKEFQALTRESISERESKRFDEGLNSKVKLSLYETFGKGIEFKNYLHEVADAWSRLFRSGTHGLNEELGRHSGREDNKERELCGNECESVSYVLWECPTYSSSMYKVSTLYELV